MRILFVSWTKENGRTADLAADLGATALFVNERGSLVTRYLRNTIITLRRVSRDRPEVLFTMLPPTPLLLVALLCRLRFKTRLGFDLHTGFFLDPKWHAFARISLRFMRNAVVIVTNESLAKVCADVGVVATVLDDPASRTEPPKVPASDGKAPLVVWPVSYANDEPINAFIEAVRALPEISFVMTGDAPKALIASAPVNLKFSGWLSADQYIALIRGATGVAALTNRAHTMQRAAYEAIAAGKPVISSDFPELRTFLGDAAVYADETTEALIRALEIFARERDKMTASVQATQERWRVSTQRGLAAVRLRLEKEH